MNARKAKMKRRAEAEVYINGVDFTEISAGDDFALLSAFESGDLIVMSRRDWDLMNKNSGARND